MLRRRPPFHPRPLRRMPFAARSLGLGSIARDALEELRKAHALFAAGAYGPAAETYERLSHLAQQNGMPNRAAYLSLQASRAHFASGNVPAAQAQALEGLSLLARSGRIARVPFLLERIVQAFEARGHTAEGKRLREQVEEMLQTVGASREADLTPPPAEAKTGRGTLPTRCAGCGAPLVPDEVEWRDAVSALCPYCGAVAQVV